MKELSSPDQYFRTDHLQADLKQRSVRGGAVTLMAQVSKFITRTGSTVVLARLLTPEDYGLIGMVAIVTGFAELCRDLGLSVAIVQKADINHKQVSNLFWINMAVSTALALIVALGAPVIAWFYHEPRLTWITVAMSVTFILGGLTNQHQALLRRQMLFTSLAKIQIVSSLGGVAIGIAAAFYGADYWSLLIMQLATAIINVIGVWAACGWRPGLPARNAGIRSMLAFGSNVTGFNLVNYFSRNLDNVLIGRYWGSHELGVYARAYQLILLPIDQINTPVSSVALPALSSLQTDINKYSSYYYKAVLSIASISMPLIGFMFASADKLILLLLGKQWLDTVPIFQLLMPAAFNSTVGVAMGWVYQSLGRVDRQLRWGIVSSAINVVLFMVGVRWGAIGVAAAYGLTRPLFLIAGFIYCYHGTPLRLRDLVNTLYRPTIASLSAAAALAGIHLLLPPDMNLLLGLLLDCLLYGLLYIGILLILPDGKHHLVEMLSVTKSLKAKK